MFTGSLDIESKKILSKVLDKVTTKKVYIGCSGNFTFDKIASKKGFKVYSNDISLYSNIIGYTVLNKTFNFLK